MTSRPNLLLILSDQQRADTLGCVNPQIRTPSLDRLAIEGVRFDRAYPPTPVCLPCRAALATGQYPSTCGATHNTCYLPENYPFFVANYLRSHGWFTHLVGKSHFSYYHDKASKESIPFIMNREYYRRWHGPWMGFERVDLCAGHTTEKHACGMHYGLWLEEQGVDCAKFFGHTQYEAFGPWDLPEEYHNSKWVADQAIAGLERAAREKRPFYQWVNFQDPHNPCMVPEPWASMYDPAQIPTFGFKPGEPDSFDSKPRFYRETLQHPGGYAARYSDPRMPHAGNVSHFDWTPDQIQKNAACYYGMVSLLDHHLGRILDALDHLGLAENTLVVFSSDHGELLGDHGLWWKGVTAFEECQRVPMLARLPGQLPAGQATRALQSLLDVQPTFLELAGLPQPPEMEGVSQLKCWRHPSEAVRTGVLIEERPWDTDWVQLTWQTPEYKLVFYTGQEEGELYHLDTDPHQIDNLWHQPQHATTKNALIHDLLSHLATRKPIRSYRNAQT